MLNLFRRHPGDIGDSDVEIGLIKRTRWHISTYASTFFWVGFTRRIQTFSSQLKTEIHESFGLGSERSVSIQNRENVKIKDRDENMRNSGPVPGEN